MSLFFDEPLLKSDDLLRRFEEIHDYIYSNDGLSPQQTLEEFVKILFVKIYDESRALKGFNLTSTEWDNLRSGSQDSEFLVRFEELFESTKSGYSDIFEIDDRIRLSAVALGFTVNKLQSISLLDTSQDAKGLAFQKFLSHHEKKGNGQFFTPTPVIDFCVRIISPKPGEKVIDPACGSGGFLISALKYISDRSPQSDSSMMVRDNLFGLDLNKSIARIAKMKLLLEANVENNIRCGNALEDVDVIKLDLDAQDGFDIVLTNPPFGAKISNESLLSKFDLGYKWLLHDGVYFKTPKLHLNQNAEILFIERCIQLLKIGGRMAIVLPNGNLENPSLDYLRHYIRLRCRILAVVNLPQETFIPYGTGVKTSLLFLQKKDISETSAYPVFFGKVTKVGYQGNKNGTPIYVKDSLGRLVTDSLGRHVLDEEFSEVAESFKLFLSSKPVESKNTFTIDSDSLDGRLDYDFYSPINRSLLNSLKDGQYARLGDLCDIIKIKSKKLRVPDQIVEYVELSDVNTHSFEIINSTTCAVRDLPSRASFELVEGDIITAIAGNSVGTRKHATALVTQEFEGSICTNGFRILRNLKIDRYYLLHFMRSEAFLSQLYMYRTGAAIPNVSDADLANVMVSLPSMSVQSNISSVVKKAFELRMEAKKILHDMEESFSNGNVSGKGMECQPANH